MKGTRNKIAIGIGCALLSGMCFAPIEGKPEGSQFHPELSQKELQRLQGSPLAEGASQSSTAPQLGHDANIPSGNADAASLIVQAKPGSADSAALSLKQAGQDQSKPVPKPGANLMFAGMFIIIGLALVMGVRAYLDKTVPDMPEKKK